MDRSPLDPGPDDAVDPEVVPEDSPRGGITVPDANDTGTTTPPIGGWGESLDETEAEEAAEAGDADGRA